MYKIILLQALCIFPYKETQTVCRSQEPKQSVCRSQEPKQTVCHSRVLLSCCDLASRSCQLFDCTLMSEDVQVRVNYLPYNTKGASSVASVQSYHHLTPPPAPRIYLVIIPFMNYLHMASRLQFCSCSYAMFTAHRQLIPV
jgi:hypothetical protein